MECDIQTKEPWSCYEQMNIHPTHRTILDEDRRPPVAMDHGTNTADVKRSSRLTVAGHCGHGKNNALSIGDVPGTRLSVRENTIRSFNFAANNDAYYTEFDVQEGCRDPEMETPEMGPYGPLAMVLYDPHENASKESTLLASIQEGCRDPEMETLEMGQKKWSHFSREHKPREPSKSAKAERESSKSGFSREHKPREPSKSAKAERESSKSRFSREYKPREPSKYAKAERESSKSRFSCEHLSIEVQPG
ncbi:unnamed protein product [Calypogeia fissa]